MINLRDNFCSTTNFFVANVVYINFFKLLDADLFGVKSQRDNTIDNIK